MNKRVVITGLGVTAPNGVGLPDFEAAIKVGKSGIRYFEELKAMNFSCCIGEIEIFDSLAIEKFYEFGDFVRLYVGHRCVARCGFVFCGKRTTLGEWLYLRNGDFGR